MKRLIAITFGLLMGVTSHLASAANLKDQFYNAVKKQETKNQLKILRRWQLANPNDKDLYMAWFTYYKEQAFRDNRVQTIVKSDDSTSASRKKPNYKVHIEVVKNTDTTLLDSALTYLRQGIANNPDNLEMRFAQVQTLKEAERWDDYTEALLQSIDRAGQPNHKWERRKEDAEVDLETEFFGMVGDELEELLSPIDTTKQLKREEKSMVVRTRNISLKLLQYWPDDVYPLNITAITHLYLGQYREALPYLLRAKKQEQKNTETIKNLSVAYRQAGDKKWERVNLKKLIQLGNHDEKKWAKKRLKELD